MKNLLLVLFAVLFSVIGLSGIALCADTVAYTQDVSSFAITTADSAQFVCLISSAYPKTYVARIYVTTSDTTTVQKVTLYDNCNSTATATAKWSGYVSGVNDCIINFTDANPLALSRGLVVRKSSPASSVQISVLASPTK